MVDHVSKAGKRWLKTTKTGKKACQSATTYGTSAVNELGRRVDLNSNARV
jgi:hypothetical protein